MTDTFDILRKVVAGAQCKPGWKFALIVEEDGALRLRITDTECADAFDPSTPRPLNHFFPVPTATFNEKSWRRWVFEQCRRLENHELGEWLRWGDERPFAPLHGPGEDPYTVHEFRDEADVFITQDGTRRPRS